MLYIWQIYIWQTNAVCSFSFLYVRRHTHVHIQGWECQGQAVYIVCIIIFRKALSHDSWQWGQRSQVVLRPCKRVLTLHHISWMPCSRRLRSPIRVQRSGRHSCIRYVPLPSRPPFLQSGSRVQICPHLLPHLLPLTQLSNWAFKPQNHIPKESRREMTPWTMETNHNLLVLNCGWSKTCCTWPECDFARLVCLLDAWPVSPDSGRFSKRQRSAAVYSTQLHHSKQPLGMMGWEEGHTKHSLKTSAATS